MPVAGPDQNFAYRQGDLATDEILSILKEKYHVDRPHPAMPLGKKFSEDWDQLVAKLRETVRELVWTDHMAAW